MKKQDREKHGFGRISIDAVIAHTICTLSRWPMSSFIHMQIYLPQLVCWWQVSTRTPPTAVPSITLSSPRLKSFVGLSLLQWYTLGVCGYNNLKQKLSSFSILWTTTQTIYSHREISLSIPLTNSIHCYHRIHQASKQALNNSTQFLSIMRLCNPHSSHSW
jgi:hypothetical protein